MMFNLMITDKEMAAYAVYAILTVISIGSVLYYYLQDRRERKKNRNKNGK